MAYIKEYWTDKEKRAEQARKHTTEMRQKYAKHIEDAVSKTLTFHPRFASGKERNNENMEIIIDDLDSVSAVLKYAKGNAAVLNFSSYKNAGGMFINGSKAQEECLCHESFLYNVLSRKQEFYDWNSLHKNKALYLNRALYSPSILFMRNQDISYCDVITCAAPNKSAAQKYQSVSDEENSRVLRSRIKFVLDIAKEQNVSTLILGAYGCGVFGQDATEVASIFKEYLTTTHKCFDKVIFAVPKGRDGNYDKFYEVLN